MPSYDRGFPTLYDSEKQKESHARHDMGWRFLK